jgi:ABC-type arginine transport system ATPase subunit
MNNINNIQFLALIMATLYSAGAHAECKGPQNLPSEQIHVAFEENGSQISESEHTRLRDWVTIVNSKYAIQNWITIVGSASESEQRAQALAMNRAVAVARDTLADGLVNAPLQLKTQAYPIGKSGSQSSDSRNVTVEISPGCPNNCCDGL